MLSAAPHAASRDIAPVQGSFADDGDAPSAMQGARDFSQQASAAAFETRLRVTAAPSPGERCDAEGFLERAYREAFASRIPSHYPHLMCALDESGRVRGAVGYRCAGAEDLFLEHYLSEPVDVVLARMTGRPVPRAAIAEIGTLACADPGCSATLFAALAARLRALGCTHAAATATRPLRRIFRRVGFHTIDLARADAARAPGGGAAWGRYYDFDPVVVAGAIEECAGPLAARCARAQAPRADAVRAACGERSR